jgi:hypothetical protein
VVVAAAVGVYAWVSLGRMTASAIFLVLTTLALSWVLWMLFRTAHALAKEPAAGEVERASGKRKKELEREKQALMKALKEIEFDHEMGKLSDADYQEIGGNYRARAVRVMRQLDLSAGDVDYRVLVERDVKSRLEARGAQKAEAAPAPKAEAAPAAKPERPRCPSCATDNDVDAVFCKKCGHRFDAAEAAR